MAHDISIIAFGASGDTNKKKKCEIHLKKDVLELGGYKHYDQIVDERRLSVKRVIGDNAESAPGQKKNIQPSSKQMNRKEYAMLEALDFLFFGIGAQPFNLIYRRSSSTANIACCAAVNQQQAASGTQNINIID